MRIGKTQRHQREQQHYAHRSRYAELPRPAGKSFHNPLFMIRRPVPNRA